MSPMHRAIFLAGLIAVLIVFPKYTDLICIFNQCSDRPPTRPSPLRHPAFRCHAILSPRDEFAARGPSRWNSIFAISPDCRQNREAEWPRPFLPYRQSIFLFPSTSLRLANIFQSLVLNSISFVFLVVSFTALDQLINEIKWPSNRFFFLFLGTIFRKKQRL